MSDERIQPEDHVPIPKASELFDPIESLLRSRVLDPPAHPGLLASLDRFEILSFVGAGGMGVVLLARDPGTSRRVAIKLLKPEFVHDRRAVHRFLTEARHMERMSHPNILEVLEVSDRPEGPYFVLPYVERGSLASLIRPGEPLDSGTTFSVARQVAEALSHAHSRGVIHRDLKPGNVLLNAEGRALVSDFGLARTMYNDSSGNVGADQRVGTAPYMSPAVAAGQAEDTRCDIYSFGAMLYEMQTGRPPYEGRSTQEIVQCILAGPPNPILSLNPEAAPELGKIAEGAMARELRDRYAQMDDVVADLERVQKKEAILGPHGSLKPKPQASFLRIMSLSVLVALCVAVCVYFLLTFGSDGSRLTTKPEPRLTANVSNEQAEAARQCGLPVTKELDLGEGVTMRFVLIPPGEFMMGSPSDELGRYYDEGLQHRVRITRPFYMGVTEVTNGQYQQFLKDSRYDGSRGSGGYYLRHLQGQSNMPTGDNYPVVWGNWGNAQAFCWWLSEKTGSSVRLPTEAEWEYACRAVSTTAFCFGDSPAELGDYAWYTDNAGAKTHPVGQKKPNAWGLYDMHGNVWECCQDWYAEDYYSNSPISGPTGPESGEARVLRGGSWYHNPTHARSANRSSNEPTRSYSDHIGFRVVIVPTIRSETGPPAKQPGDKVPPQGEAQGSSSEVSLAMFHSSATGHVYEVVHVPGGITWDAAKSEAESRSYMGVPGYLATITSLAESQLICSLQVFANDSILSLSRCC